MASNTKAVFISYRRDESAGYAGRIADSFVAHFGEDKVFRDIDSLEPGLDFAEAIERAIESSEVLIAVIGKNWLTATDAAGRKRLENPDDYVRTEIATALRRNIRVIPLLVQDADMPSASELPDDLAPLSRRNAFELNDSSWRDDIRRLITAVETAISRNRPPKHDPREVAPGEEIAPPEEEPAPPEQEPAPPEQEPALTGSWWAMALRGLATGIFGLMLSDGLRLYGALMIIVDGLVARIDATTRASRSRPLLIQSRISILVGLLVLLVWLANFDRIYEYRPEPADLFSTLALAPRLIGSWAIFIGLIRVIAALQLRRETKNLWLMGTSGVSLAVFGIPLLHKHAPGEQYPYLSLGLLALVSGIALVAVALRVRGR